MRHNAQQSPESSLVGGAIQENRDRCALANPITYIDANDPPFLILQGDKDPLVPHCESEILNTALKRANVPTEFVLVSNGQHGQGMFESRYFATMIDFFSKVLKNKKS